MPRIKTLNNIEDLRFLGYGRPGPRHGLHLLHWFCNDYVSFNNTGDIEVSVDPKFEEYGFHHFANFRQDDGERLLPYQILPYYEVGNLFAPGAEDLPEYVRSNSRVGRNLNNIDRIIISLLPDWIVDKVYVTQHNSDVSFDRQNTFHISKGLVKTISNQDLVDLLRQVGYTSNSRASPVWPVILQSYQHPGPVASLSPPAQVNLTSDGDYRQLRDDRDVHRRLDDSRPERVCNCTIL